LAEKIKVANLNSVIEAILFFNYLCRTKVLEKVFCHETNQMESGILKDETHYPKKKTAKIKLNLIFLVSHSNDSALEI